MSESSSTEAPVVDIPWSDGNPEEHKPADGTTDALVPGTLAYRLHYMYPKLGKRDAWGVRIVLGPGDEYAEITLEVPDAFPDVTRQQLEPFVKQRISYTAEDREWEREGCVVPHNLNEAGPFIRALSRALDETYAALTDALFAHARGEVWNCRYTAATRT